MNPKPEKRKLDADQAGPSGVAANGNPPPPKTPKKSLKDRRLEKAAKGFGDIREFFQKR